MITRKDFEIHEKQSNLGLSAVYTDDNLVYVTEDGFMYMTTEAWRAMGSPKYIVLGYHTAGKENRGLNSTTVGLFPEEAESSFTYAVARPKSNKTGSVHISALSFCEAHGLIVKGFTVSYSIDWIGNEIHFHPVPTVVRRTLRRGKGRGKQG